MQIIYQLSGVNYTQEVSSAEFISLISGGTAYGTHAYVMVGGVKYVLAMTEYKFMSSSSGVIYARSMVMPAYLSGRITEVGLCNSSGERAMCTIAGVNISSGEDYMIIFSITSNERFSLTEKLTKWLSGASDCGEFSVIALCESEYVTYEPVLVTTSGCLDWQFTLPQGEFIRGMQLCYNGEVIATVDYGSEPTSQMEELWADYDGVCVVSGAGEYTMTAEFRAEQLVCDLGGVVTIPFGGASELYSADNYILVRRGTQLEVYSPLLVLETVLELTDASQVASSGEYVVCGGDKVAVYDGSGVSELEVATESVVVAGDCMVILRGGEVSCYDCDTLTLVGRLIGSYDGVSNCGVNFIVDGGGVLSEYTSGLSLVREQSFTGSVLVRGAGYVATETSVVLPYAVVSIASEPMRAVRRMLVTSDGVYGVGEDSVYSLSGIDVSSGSQLCGGVLVTVSGDNLLLASVSADILLMSNAFVVSDYVNVLCDVCGSEGSNSEDLTLQFRMEIE